MSEIMEPNKRKLDVFEVGAVVEVERRERKWFKKAMPGNGGAGKVVKVNQDENGGITYNVKYFINGSEKGVLPQHMSRPVDLAKREVAEREFLQPGDYENERAVARAAQRVLDLEAVAKRRALKAASSSTSNSQQANPSSTFIYPAEVRLNSFLIRIIKFSAAYDSCVTFRVYFDGYSGVPSFSFACLVS